MQSQNEHYEAGKDFLKSQQGTNAMDKIVKIKAGITPAITINHFQCERSKHNNQKKLTG